jgi:hypothetical protein
VSATAIRTRIAAALVLTLALAPSFHAQIKNDDTLTQSEIDQIRDARYYPESCVLLFVKFLDLRVHEVQDLYAHPRRPGREQDTHDLIEQFTSITDELSDNLDDYGPRHIDLRKVLPKIIDATDRWSSALKSPPDDPTYSVSRKVALESIRDLREDATELQASQAAYFKLHPPSKQQNNNNQAPPIDIPR